MFSGLFLPVVPALAGAAGSQRFRISKYTFPKGRRGRNARIPFDGRMMPGSEAHMVQQHFAITDPSLLAMPALNQSIVTAAAGAMLQPITSKADRRKIQILAPQPAGRVGLGQTRPRIPPRIPGTPYLIIALAEFRIPGTPYLIIALN
jgi:hypothetical protein